MRDSSLSPISFLLEYDRQQSKSRVTLLKDTPYLRSVKVAGRYSLFGCTVAPGFTGDIFEGGTRETLLKMYPDRAEDINRLSVNGETNMPDGFAA